MTELDDLCKQSIRWNEASDVTGLLVYNKRRFMQVIEGSAESVQNLMARIVVDHRYDSIAFLADDHIAVRSFEGWGLKFIGYGKNMTRTQFADDVKEEVKNMMDVHVAAAFIGFARLVN